MDSQEVQLLCVILSNDVSKKKERKEEMKNRRRERVPPAVPAAHVAYRRSRLLELVVSGQYIYGNIEKQKFRRTCL